MTVPSPPPAPPKKKGLSPLAWVGIGCGVVLLLGAIAFAVLGYGVTSFFKKQARAFEENPVMAAAELAVKLNPDYDLVSKDEENNTLTIKNNKTGEVVTLSAEDVKEGRFTVTTEEGTMELETSGEGAGTVTVRGAEGEKGSFEFGGGAAKVPSWMPSYPGGTSTGSFSSDTPEGHAVAFTLTTADSVKEVLDFYERELKAAGLTVHKTSLDSGGATVGGTVTGESANHKRTANVVVSQATGGTQAIVNVMEKP